MAKQIINVGAAANDKKGDSLRASFQKVNANFTELYTALGLNADTTLNLGAFEFVGSTMSTTDSTAIVIDQATTITSNLTVGGDIVPSIANGGNLGSLSKPFNSLYVSNSTVYFGGIPLSLEAGTNELTINNVPISQTITYADIPGSPTVPTDISDLDDADGLLGGSTSVDTTETRTDIENWDTAEYHGGEGSYYITFTNIAPNMRRWYQQYMDNSKSTGRSITLNDSISVTYNSVEYGGNGTFYLYVDEAPSTNPTTITSIDAQCVMENKVAISETGQIDIYSGHGDPVNIQSGFRGDVTVRAGDDISLLAGNKVTSDDDGGSIQVVAGSGGSADNNDAGGGGGYVNIYGGDGGGSSNTYQAGSGGSVRVQSGSGGNANSANNKSAGQGANLFIRAGDAGSNDGDVALGLPGGSVEINAGYSSSTDAGGGISLQAGGGSTVGGSVNISAGEGGTTDGSVYINTVGGDLTWEFGADGSLTLPHGAGFVYGETGQLKTNDGTTLTLDFRDTSGRGFYTNDSGYTLRSNGTYNWIFDGNGNTQFPSDIIKTRVDERLHIDVYDDQEDYASINLRNWDLNEDQVTAQLTVGRGDVGITAGATKNWTFNADGSLTVPPNGIIGVPDNTGGTGGYIQFYGAGGEGPGESGYNLEPNSGDIDIVAGVDGGGVSDTNYSGDMGNIRLKTSAYTGEAVNEWKFGWDGNLTFPNGETIVSQPGQIYIHKDDEDYVGEVVVQPGGAGIQASSLIDDRSSFVTAGLNSVEVRVVDPQSNNFAWRFDAAGKTTFPGNTIKTPSSLSIKTPTGSIPTGVANWNGQGGWNQGFYGNLATTGGTGEGLTVDVAAGGGGYISINQITINTPGTGYTNGDVITIDNENNLPGTFTVVIAENNWDFGTDGKLTFPDSTEQTTAFTGTADVARTVESENNVNIRVNLTDSTQRVWQFGEDGNLTFPDGTNYSGSTITLPTTTNGIANKVSWNFADLTIGSSTTSLEWNLLSSTLSDFLIGTSSAATPFYFTFDGTGQTLGAIPNSGVTGGGKLTFGTATKGAAGNADDIELTSTNEVHIKADANIWTFSDDGTLTVPGDIHGAVVMSGGGSPSPVGRTVDITPAPDASDKTFGFRIDQFGETFTRAYLDMPQAEVDKQVAATFAHANGTAGYIFNQGADTNLQGMNNAFNIFYNSGDIKITAMASGGALKTWTFGDDSALTLPDNAVIQTTNGNISIKSENYVYIDTTDGGQIEIGRNSTNGVVILGQKSTTADVFTDGDLFVEAGVYERFSSLADATGVVTHNCANGHIFYHTSPDANWTVNLTNFNSVVSRATSVTLIITQGGTGYYPSALQIGGAAQTINWLANATPTPSTNRIDVVTFSIICTATNTYTVLGQMTGF